MIDLAAIKHCTAKPPCGEASMADGRRSYHVQVLVLVEPSARHSGIKSEEREGAEHVLIKLQVVAMNVMRHLQKTHVPDQPLQ